MKSLHAIVLAMRPSQWTKNLVVFAAFFFAFWDITRTDALRWTQSLLVLPAAALFCLASSGIYLVNDIRDLEADRHHPVKCRRPLASGTLSVSLARRAALVCLGLALGGAFLLSVPFGLVVGTYVLLQFIYTFGLKRVALVDIMVIAAGFVLRAIAGAVVLPDVTISPWLLLCTFLLALFLALCKRRHEKLLPAEADDDEAYRHRPALEKYDAKLLDQLISIAAGATIVSYSIYTFWPETVDKFGTNALGCTIPLVVFGIFRYLDLAYRHELADRPEKILLTDGPLLLTLGLYALTVIIVFLL